MDEKEIPIAGESSITDTDTKIIKVNPSENEDQSPNANIEDAGPSGNLPGSVPRILKKPGRSKSEHSIIHIITSDDVENALKLTSMSFGQTKRRITDLNLQDLRLPKEKDENALVDIKKFMATCYRTNDMPKDVVIPLQAIQLKDVIPVHATPMQPKANTSALTNVLAELKESRTSDENKKTSGSISERSDLGVGARDSLSSIGSNVCRICMTRGKERLISPCNCKGSLANVHLSCLERWLNQVGRNHCELCGYSYPAIRTPRYTVLQAIRLWFGNPRNRGHLQSDCLIFWLLSTVTAGLLAVCVVGAQYFVLEGSKFGKPRAGLTREGISHRITETAMDFFMAIVLCGYTVTVYLLWKDHFVMWNRWRRANVNVRLLLSPDASPVPFVPRRHHVV